MGKGGNSWERNRRRGREGRNGREENGMDGEGMVGKERREGGKGREGNGRGGEGRERIRKEIRSDLIRYNGVGRDRKKSW